MQNVRKRVVRDVENAHKYGTERLLQSLLPTVDSLEKSVEAAAQVSDANAGLVEGIEICLKMLMDVLAKENVEQIDPEGEPFDPQFHEAISMVEKPEMEPNSVALVVQKGYRLNGRLVRPAMVIVSKAEEGTAQDGAAAEGTAEDKGAPSGGAQDGAAPTESPSGGAPGGNAPNGKAAQDRAAEDNDGPKGDTPRIDEKA